MKLRSWQPLSFLLSKKKKARAEKKQARKKESGEK
jgi:hypothetical protein